MAAKKAKKTAIKDKYTKSAILAELAETTELSKKQVSQYLTNLLHSSNAMLKKAAPVNLHFQVCSRSKLLRSLLVRLAKVFLILSVQGS